MYLRVAYRSRLHCKAAISDTVLGAQAFEFCVWTPNRYLNAIRPFLDAGKARSALAARRIGRAETQRRKEATFLPSKTPYLCRYTQSTNPDR